MVFHFKLMMGFTETFSEKKKERDAFLHCVGLHIYLFILFIYWNNTNLHNVQSCETCTNLQQMSLQLSLENIVTRLQANRHGKSVPQSESFIIESSAHICKPSDRDRQKR